MADEIEYKLDDVPTTTVAPEDIDTTFRSSCIGMSRPGQNTKSPSHTQDKYMAVD